MTIKCCLTPLDQRLVLGLLPKDKRPPLARLSNLLAFAAVQQAQENTPGSTELLTQTINALRTLLSNHKYLRAWQATFRLTKVSHKPQETKE